MKFILQFTTGEKFRINQEEAEAIARAGESQSITIKRLGMVVQKRMAQVYPINHPDVVEDRKKQTTGVLHDGTRVKRHFGEWVIAGETYPDDSGNYQPIKLDKEYYPEVAVDSVASEEEFSQIKLGEYNKFMGITSRAKRLNNSEGLTHI